MTDDFDPVTYQSVNDAWRGTPSLSPITAAQSKAIFLKLIAKFGGRHRNSAGRMRDNVNPPGYASRTMRSWAQPKAYRPGGGPVNGLPRAVHDASHAVHERLHRHMKTHCQPHAALEQAMIEHVIAKGWHLPKPKPVRRAKVEPTMWDKRDAVDAAIKRWTTKLRRAETALRKLNAKKRRLERAVATSLAVVAQPVQVRQ